MIMFLQITTLGFGLLLLTDVQIILGCSSIDAGVVLLPSVIIGATFLSIDGVISNIMFVSMISYLTRIYCIVLYFIYSLGIGLIVGNTMTCALSHLIDNLQADGNVVTQTLMELFGRIGF